MSDGPLASDDRDAALPGGQETSGASNAAPQQSSDALPSFGNDPRLQQRLEAYAADLLAGRPAGRDELLETFPGEASRLAEALDALEHLHAVVPGVRPADDGNAATALPADAFADFCILRELGRGGMGIVYEAQQRSLVRRVALKVLPFAAALDPRSLARFRQESLAAAQLDHPNIVRVYGVGCDRGVHYYAMQYIEGQSLAHVIGQMRARVADCASSAHADDDTVARARFDLSTERTTNRPEYYRAVARIGVQVAQALDYAHVHGILHRDIKPGNLMLDDRGSVWVTDFGLARVDNEANLTMTGDILGTLRYMSPEQACARRGLVDQRTDVYSLGATLYEMLTLQPTFPGEDRGELLRQISQDEPAPPRLLERTIPRELETIVLKAIEKEPRDRYATAHDLALDLQRFLDDQPLAARRASPAERLVKWSRRHRSLVASLAVSVLLSLVGLTIVALVYAKQQGRLADGRSELVREQKKLQQRTTTDLYRALLGRSRALLFARTPNYRSEVWKNLLEAVALDVPDKDLDAVKEQGLACLGDPFGLGPQPASAIVRRAPASPVDWFDLPQGEQSRPAAKLVHAVANDGSLIAMALTNGEITIVDKSGKRQAAASPVGPVHSLDFSPSARFLAAGCEEGVVVWGLEELSPELVVRGDVIQSVAFHPSGLLVALLTRERRVELWSLASHRLVHTLLAPRPTSHIEVSRDGNHLLAISGNQVLEAHSITATPEKRYLLGHTGAVTAVEFSPDGTALVSVSKDRSVRLWDTTTGELRRTLDGHRREIQDAAFSPDGSLVASGDWSGAICLWDVESGARLGRINAIEMPGQIWRLRFEPQGRYLAAAGQKGFAAWSMATPGEGVSPLRLFTVRQPNLLDLAIHPAGADLAMLDRSGNLHTWRMSAREAPRRLPLVSNVDFPSLSFDSAGQDLTYVARTQAVGLWDWDRARAAGVTGRRFTGTTCVRLARTRDGRRMAVAAPANQIVVYDLETDRELVQLPAEKAEIWTLNWNPAGTRLAIGLADGTIAIWELGEVRKALGELGIELSSLTDRAALHSPAPALTDGEVANIAAGEFRQQLAELARSTERAVRSGYIIAVDQASFEATRLGALWRMNAHHAGDLQLEATRMLNDVGFAIANAFPGLKAERVFRSAIATAGVQTSFQQGRSFVDVQRAQGYYGLGQSLESQTKHAEAADLYRQAVEILAGVGDDLLRQPEIGQLRMAAGLDLGRALAAAGRSEEATEVLRESLHFWTSQHDESSATATDAWVGASHLLSELLNRAGRPVEAERQLRNVLELRPNDVATWNRLAWLLANSPDVEGRRAAEAVSLAQKAVGLSPSTAAWWNTLGAAHVRARAWKPALAALKVARSLNRSQSFAHDGFLLAICEWESGRPAASKAWSLASRHWMDRFAPDDVELASLRREVADLVDADQANVEPGGASGTGDALLDLMNEIIEADPESGWAFLERGWLHVQGGRKAEAVADLRRAAQSRIENAAELERLATGFQRLSCWNDALSAFERWLDRHPNDVAAMNSLAWVLATCPQQELQNAQRALALATRAVALNPGHGALWNTLGVARYRMGNWNDSRDALRFSLLLLHDFEFAVNGFFLAMVSCRLNDHDLAAKWYAAASRWSARYGAGNEEMARFGREAAALLGMPEPPEPGETKTSSADPEVFTLINAVLPRAAWVLVKRAECHAALDNTKQAVADLVAAVDVAGDDLLSRATILNQTVADLAASVDFAGADLHARTAILSMACRLADWKTVIHASRDLSARHIANWVPIYFRARAWMELGEWEQALDDLADLAELTPDDNDIVAAQACVNLAAGHDSTYCRSYQTLLERTQAAPSPRDLTAPLETLLAIPPADFDATPLVALAERAAAAPERSPIVAAALYRSGRFAQAVETFDAVARVAPLRARDHLFLALAHHRLGHSEAAFSHLRHGSENKPAGDQNARDQNAAALSPWCQRLATERLRREAEALVRN